MLVFKEPAQWARGLMGFTQAQAKDGALFILHQEAPWPISSDGLDFPIDVFWLSEGGMVLEHAEVFPGMGIVWPDVQSKLILELPMQEQPAYRIGDFVEVPHDASANT